MRFSSFIKNRFALKPVGLACLLLGLLALSVMFAPLSQATREIPNVTPQEPSATVPKRRRPEFVPGEVLVRFKPNQAFEGATYIAVPNNNSSSKNQNFGLADPQEEVRVSVERFGGSEIIEGLRIARTASTDTLKAVAALQARDDVLYAEPNYILHADKTPNDPLFPNPPNSGMYGLQKIAAPQAWDTTTGNTSIVVGVIDEGIDITHLDLKDNIWTNPGEIAGNGIDDDANGFIDDRNGFDFRDNTGTFPPEFHATHVAGTIGARGNNNLGVVGVNWEVSLMSLRFLSAATGNGSDADAVTAYGYAKMMRDLWASSHGAKGANIRVLNASFGGGGYSQAAADALNAAGQSGILFVAAAGNESTNNDTSPHYPSGYRLPNVISVTATDSSDHQTFNYGLHSVDIGAPGVSILSTLTNNQYGVASGTSMAAPHVTGAAALLWAANPNLSVSQVRALLSFNGDILPSLQGKTLTGRRLNVFKSLQALTENDTTAPGTVSDLHVTSQNGRTIGLTWTASGDDGGAGKASLYDLSFIDQFTGAVVPLTSVAPAASGAQQSISLNIPYRHTAGRFNLREFDNVGNEGVAATVPVSVDPLTSDPYAATVVAHTALSTGGTALGLTFDDCYHENYTLPFNFPFFGQSYGKVTVSTNGNLYFSPPPKRNNPDCTGTGIADDVPSSISDLSKYKMIAGMWDDLDLNTSRRADADVYVVQPDANRIIFRWQGVQFGDGTNGDPINFEIELNSNGVIKTRYGSGNTNLNPVVGISGGEPDTYVIGALTSELSPKTLTNAQNALFTPRAMVPLPSVQFNAPSFSASEAAQKVTLTVRRTGDTTSSAKVNFATSDAAGSQNCNIFNGKASSRCDYITLAGTVQFGPGDSTKTFIVPIIDDTYAEGSETFTVTLSNPTGAILGSPNPAIVTISDNGDAGGANPIDATDFFVREQYIDFFSREPDTGGFNFWKDQINSCGADAQCIDIKRTNVSAAFFVSVEFQQTGYLVERLYRAAYGAPDGVPIVRFNEFLPDTQAIGRGVVVNAPGWETLLENNKQAFIEEFVKRARFTTKYPSNISPGTFVTALNTNSGNALSSAERNQLVSDLTAGVKTRAQVLRAVAEDQDLYNAEFNRAFVLMQYFGYLRRNPDDLPNTDYSGFEFWLNKLNVANGNYIKAEMVRSFLVSGEYRQRFGTP
jgi:subtilisin family serine protease